MATNQNNPPAKPKKKPASKWQTFEEQVESGELAPDGCDYTQAWQQAKKQVVKKE